MSRIKVLFSCVAFCAVLLSGCSDYYTPVRDFLEEYTNSAAIGSQSITVPTERDRDGIECVSSDTDVTLTFFLRNPRSYDLFPELTFNNASLAVSQGFFSLTPDHQSITLTFHRSWLQSCEQAEPGTDLSGSISLTETATGRAFPSWDFSLRCNTPPPRPEGARIMRDDATGTYVLCFNLDLTNPVHKDLASLTINGELFEITEVKAGTERSITFSDSRLSTTRPPQIVPIGSLPSFSEDPNNPKVYFSSGIPQTTGTQNFTVTIRDTMGLSSTVSTSTAGDMLAPVTVMNTTGTYADSDEYLRLVPETDGTFFVILSHADSTATIHYTWDDIPQSISASTPANIPIDQSGTLKVWATKPGYVASSIRYINIICRSNEYYVDPGTNGSDSNPGTRTRPFKTVKHAITQFNNATDPTNTIFLMDNVTALENNSTNSGIVSLSPSDNVTFTIDGSTHFAGSPLMNAYNNYATISGIGQYRSIHIGAEGDSTVTLTLKNLNITSGHANDFGAGIYFQSIDNGSSLTLDNCVVEGNRIAGTGSLSGAGVYFVGEKFTMRNGCRVTSNTICNSGDGSMQGAGIYISGSSNSATADITDTVIGHNSNAPASTATGYGGGIYAVNIDLSISDTSPSDSISTSITSNTANSDHTGQGGGIAYYGTSLTLNGAEIQDNIASTGGTGCGGGVYVSSSGSASTTINLNSSVSITRNRASQTGTGNGEGLYIASSVETKTLKYNAGTIELGRNDCTSNNVLYLGQGTQLNLEGAVSITDGNVYLDTTTSGVSPVIKTIGYIPEPEPLNPGDPPPPVAHLVPSDYSWTPAILTGEASINYYKFTVESNGGTKYCINAAGKLSEIVEESPTDFDTLWLKVTTAPNNGKTLLITLPAGSPFTVNDTIPIKTDTHIRIIPSGNMTFTNSWAGSLFTIAGRGNLLLGGNHSITVDCSPAQRAADLITMNGTGSIVLRKVAITDSIGAIDPITGSTGGASLISSGTIVSGYHTVVLEDVTYDTTVPYQTSYNSATSALRPAGGSIYHLVSGSIKHFRSRNYGGVALLTGGTFYLHSNVVLSGNSTSPIVGGVSITELGGVLDNPHLIPLE